MYANHAFKKLNFNKEKKNKINAIYSLKFKVLLYQAGGGGICILCPKL
jgi:hypothetical protein